MKYYIRFRRDDGRKAYVMLCSDPNQDGVIYDVIPDRFSKVARPPLRPGWARELGLSETERRRVLRARVAYTRVWEK